MCMFDGVIVWCYFIYIKTCLSSNEHRKQTTKSPTSHWLFGVTGLCVSEFNNTMSYYCIWKWIKLRKAIKDIKLLLMVKGDRARCWLSFPGHQTLMLLCFLGCPILTLWFGRSGQSPTQNPLPSQYFKTWEWDSPINYLTNCTSRAQSASEHFAGCKTPGTAAVNCCLATILENNLPKVWH